MEVQKHIYIATKEMLDEFKCKNKMKGYPKATSTPQH